LHVWRRLSGLEIKDLGQRQVPRALACQIKQGIEGAAKAKLDELKRGDDTLTIMMPGDPLAIRWWPLVAAEGQIIVLGFRIGVSGLWSITSARHEIGRGGFSTRIKTEKPRQ